MRLIIDNSMSRIEGLTTQQFKIIKSLLSRKEKVYGPIYKKTGRGLKIYRGWNIKSYPMIDKKGNFPTGLLYIVRAGLTKLKLNPLVINHQILPVRKLGLFPYQDTNTPYPEQMAAANAALKHHRGIICAPTALGKSLIATLIIGALQVRTLVVTPNLGLKEQMIKALTKAFGGDKVGSIALNRAIAVENVDALDINKVIDNYDCIIIDEFHHSGAATYRKLNKKAWNKIYYRFGLTATPFRSKDSERLLLESVLSKIIYRISYETAVDKGYIAPMEVYYYDLPIQDMEGNENNWSSVYSELVVNNKTRNDLILSLLDLLKGKSTLCLVKEISHGTALAGAKLYPFATGESGNSQSLINQFNSQSITTLIGTVGVLGEGVDTKPAEFVILAGGGKSKNQFMQNVGRGFRLHPTKDSCKIIMFRDKSHKWLLEHFKACCKYLKEEYGVKPVKLET